MAQTWKDAGDEEKDLTTVVHRFVDSVRWRRQAKSETRTGADGRYRLEGLLDVKHRLVAERPGWKFRSQASWNATPGSTVDFVASPRTEVRFDVFLPDGSQPGRAMIRLRSGSSTAGQGWSRDHPDVDVAPGTYEVTATAGDSQEYQSQSVSLTVESGVPTPAVRLDLEGRPVIRGRVVFEDDQNSEVRVRLARVPEGRKADPALLAPDGATETSMFGGGPFGAAPGAFRFTDLTPGHYLLGVARSWRGAIVATTEVEVGHEPVDVEIRVPPLSRDEYAILRVTGPDRKPLTSLNVTTGYVSDHGASSGGSVVIDRPGGEKWVLHHEGGVSTAEGGKLWITVSHPAYGSKTVEYAPGAAPTFDVRFAEPGTLDVDVPGLAGGPYVGRVQATLMSGGEERVSRGDRRTEKPDEHGHLQFTGVQPGPYVVLLQMADRHGWGQDLARKEVTASAGANRVAIPLPALYEVTLEGIQGHTWIQREEKGAVRMRTISNASEGRAILDGLPAGTYTAHSGGTSVTFTLPGATTVRIE
jgi:hypothetical protein